VAKQQLLAGFHGANNRRSINQNREKYKPLMSGEVNIVADVFGKFSGKCPWLPIKRVSLRHTKLL
jgi:hypothetical protein